MRHYPSKVVLSIHIMCVIMNRYFGGSMPTVQYYEYRRKYLYNKYNYEQLEYYLNHITELKLPNWFVPEYNMDRTI